MKRVINYTLLIILFFNCEEKYLYKTEGRGLWITRFAYTTNLDSIDINLQQKAIKNLLEEAERHNFNFVLFQIRGNGTVFYNSGYEPWAVELTGTLGENPSWDPLKFAIDLAHSNGLELHAWVNTFPAWRGELLPEDSNPKQIILQYPEWICCDSTGNTMKLNPGYVSLSPGIPQARKHIQNTVLEIVKNYDVDGIHFDYIRYPEGASYKGYSMDKISLKRFNSINGNPLNLDWEEWQREQITTFLRNFHYEAKKIKPFIKISCAVIGKYKGTGWTAYNHVYQDPKKWMEEGIVDFIIPMIYWKRNRPNYEYSKLLYEWRQNNKKYVFPGIALYRASGYDSWEHQEIKSQIDIARRLKTGGFVLFSSDALPVYYDKIFDNYKNFSNFPSIYPQKYDVAVNSISAAVTDSSVVLSWKSVEKPLFFNIYKSENFAISGNTSKWLYKKVYGEKNKFEDKNVQLGKSYFYKISAIDHYGNESNLSKPVQIRF